MNNLINFNERQLKFLQKNYDVYNPYTQTRNKDFSTLLGRKVFFIGEFHGLLKFKKLHQKLISILAGTSETALLLEGTAPSQPTERPYFTNFPPNIHMRGADMRVMNYSPTDDKKLHQLLWQQAQLDQAWYYEAKTVRRKIEMIFRAGLDSSDIVVSDQHLLLSLRVTQRIWNAMEKLIGIDSDSRKIQAQIDQLNEQYSLSANILDDFDSSNKKLFDEIVDSREEVIITIWGLAHPTSTESEYRDLAERNISFAVLLPTQKKCEQALKRMEATQPFLIPYRIFNESRTFIEEGTANLPRFDYDFPKEIIGFFNKNRAIQTSNVVLNGKQFSELFQNVFTVTLEANQPYCFSGAMGGDLRRLGQLLLPHGMCLDSLHSTGTIQQKPVFHTEKPSTIIISDKPIVIAVEKTRLLTSAFTLFLEMHRQEISELSIAPGQQLWFGDIFEEEIERILSVPLRFMSWVLSKLPPGTHLAFKKREGGSEVIFNRGKTEIGYPALVLTTDTGFTMELLPSCVETAS